MAQALALETNYFTCTLGEAQVLNESNPDTENETVNDVLFERAIHDGRRPAVGFPNPHKSSDRAAIWQKSYRKFDPIQLMMTDSNNLYSNVLRALLSVWICY